MSMEATPMKPSDTPRTDAEQEHVNNAFNDQVCTVLAPDPYFVPVGFARQLERELAEWEACARRLAATLRSELRGEPAAYSATGNPCAVDDLAEYDRLKLKSSP